MKDSSMDKERITLPCVLVNGGVTVHGNINEIHDVPVVYINLSDGLAAPQKREPKAQPNEGIQRGRPKRIGKPLMKSFVYDAGNETNVRLQMLYNGLLAKGWIRNDTDLRGFLSLFTGKETTCRVTWTGEISTLAELFKELVTRKGLVRLPQGESLWVMVNARFWEKEGNREFGNKRLGSTQAPIDNKDDIDLLVMVMDPEVPIATLRKAIQTRK